MIAREYFAYPGGGAPYFDTFLYWFPTGGGVSHRSLHVEPLCGGAFLLVGSGVLNETLLGSDYLARSGLSLLTFTLHPYGRIAAFGFTLVGAFGLLTASSIPPLLNR